MAKVFDFLVNATVCTVFMGMIFAVAGCVVYATFYASFYYLGNTPLGALVAGGAIIATGYGISFAISEASK